MKRLIEDAAKLSDTVDAQDMSFANIVKAINVVQTEMGITGTTALEAGRTISGSVGAMKAAWTNLITGLADGNADIGQLVDNLATTIVGDGTEENLGVFGNVLPAVQTALTGASTLISELLPQIVQIIPMVITENLPILAEAAISIIQSLADGIGQNQEMLMTTAFDTIVFLANSLISMLPQIVALGLDLIASLANGIAESLPELIPTIIDVVLQIVDTLTDSKNLSNLLDAALTIILALVDGLVDAIPKLIEATVTLIEKLVVFLLEPSNLKKLAEAAVKIVVALAEGLIKSVGTLMGSVGKLISNVVAKFKKTDWGQVGKDVVNGIWEGLKGVWKKLESWFTDQWDNLVGGVKDLLGIHSPSRVFAGIGENMALGLGEGWDNEFGSIRRGINGSLNFSTGTIDYGSSAFGVGSSKMASGMQDNFGVFGGNATIVVQSVLDGKVIGETAYQYSKNKGRMYGMA